MKLMVFDVGGTEIKYGLMDDDLKITENGHVPTPMDSFEHFAQVIQEIYNPFKKECEGIAMSLPGFVDTENGRVNGGGALSYNWGTPVAGLLSERCGCPVVLENDGKAAAQAEFYCGSLKGCKNAAVFVIGTGVGGGLIINGELVRGRHFTAGEFSFVNTDSSRFDAVDSFMGFNCSTSALLSIYQEKTHSEESIDGREFFTLLESDPFAKESLDLFTERIAKQIYNLYWLLDLEKVAIGGGISRQPILLAKINEKFEQIKKDNPVKSYLPDIHIEIVPSTFGNDANLIGAYMTYCQRMKSC